jgi:ribosomal protein S12 methylthiotransferase accessory factor
VLHGLLELVERDAVALWWYARARRPAFAWETLGSERLEALIDLIRDRQRGFHLLDLTTDLKIPVFAAVSVKSNGTGLLLGTAASLDPEIAIWKATSELAKIFLPGIRAGMLGRLVGCRTVLMAQIHNAWEPPPRADVEVTDVTEVTKAAELKKHAHG